MRRQLTESRFWSKVEKRGPDECWMWTGKKDRVGYGMMMFRGKRFTAHRLGYLLTFGEFDQTLDCCHTCDTPGCCNPNHIFLGTAKDNIHDAIKKGRFARGDRIGTSRLSDTMVLNIVSEYKNGKKSCPEIAKEIGTSTTCVYCVVAGRTWKHITGGQSITREAKGETLKTSTLTESDVKRLRQLRETLGITFKELGSIFGITPTGAHDIVRRKTWKHI